MLSRFCNFSQKLVKFKQISSHSHGYLAPASFNLSQKSYATENETKTIENYTTTGNLKDALKTLKQASTNNESFKLDCKRVAELMELMIEKNHPFEEIEAILSAHRPSLGSNKSKCRLPLFENLLSRLAITGQVQLLQKLFDTLIKYNYIDATIETTGCLVKASLYNGAYAQAVDMFEYMDKTYQFNSMTMVLFNQLIQQKEEDLLHRVYKIHEQRFGTRYALCRLGFAYSECGQDRRAKTTFEKINDDLSKDIILACRGYVKFAQLHMAKTLLTATKGIIRNRDVIYEAILDIYTKKNKPQEALELWHEYINDDILPTQRFKKKLAEFLNANSMKIPSDLDLKNDKKKNDSYVNASDENINENETPLAKTIENHTTAGSLKNALDMSKQVKNESFQLDCPKVAELVKSMVESKNPFEDIEAILSVHSPSKSESNFRLFENIMSRLATTGQVQLLKQLFDALIKYNYIEATVKSTGFLVKGLLNNGAHAQALDMFEHIAKTYQLTPMSFILFTELIEHNETDLLKRLFKICEQMLSTQIAFCKLGLAFVECGKDRQAKEIFETVDIIWKDIISACQRYVKNGSLQKANTLLAATKGLISNRDVIYESILHIYINQNKAQDALNLWHKYTNDEMLQSQTFKNKLVTLLKANRIEIPLNLNLNEKIEK